MNQALACTPLACQLPCIWWGRSSYFFQKWREVFFYYQYPYFYRRLLSPYRSHLNYGLYSAHHLQRCCYSTISLLVLESTIIRLRVYLGCFGGLGLPCQPLLQNCLVIQKEKLIMGWNWSRWLVGRRLVLPREYFWGCWNIGFYFVKICSLEIVPSISHQHSEHSFYALEFSPFYLFWCWIGY